MLTNLTIEQLVRMTPAEIQAYLEKEGFFRSEEFGFAEELAGHFGFVYIDDEATQMSCSTVQLYTLMKALGYQRVAQVSVAERQC